MQMKIVFYHRSADLYDNLLHLGKIAEAEMPYPVKTTDAVPDISLPYGNCEICGGSVNHIVDWQDDIVIRFEP